MRSLIFSLNKEVTFNSSYNLWHFPLTLQGRRETDSKLFSKVPEHVWKIISVVDRKWWQTESIFQTRLKEQEKRILYSSQGAAVTIQTGYWTVKNSLQCNTGCCQENLTAACAFSSPPLWLLQKVIPISSDAAGFTAASRHLPDPW